MSEVTTAQKVKINLHCNVIITVAEVVMCLSEVLFPSCSTVTNAKNVILCYSFVHNETTHNASEKC